MVLCITVQALSQLDTLAIRGRRSLSGSSLEEGQASRVAGARLLAWVVSQQAKPCGFMLPSD